MIHRIYSDLPTFKNLELHVGLNVLLADRQPGATDQQTRNRAGKSSLVQVIHFALGSNVAPDSIFRRDELKGYRFGLDFDLPGQRIAAERSGAHHGRIVIREGDTSGLTIQPSLRRGVGNSFSCEDWRAVLGERFFGIPISDNRERVAHSPSFRSLISYFIRRENDGGFRRPEAQSTMQQIGDQQVAIAYLLDLDWKIAQAWELVRQREKTLAELRKAASAGAFGDVISSSAQLRTELVLAEQAALRLQDTLSRFEVLPEYRELEQEGSRLTRELNGLANQNTLDEQLLAELHSAIGTERPPAVPAVSRLYEEAGIALPEAIVRRFEEVQEFHHSVIANRRDYLQAELSAAEERLRGRRQEMQMLDSRRAEIMRTLNSRGALDQFQRLQQEAARQEAETEAIRQRFQAAEQLEGSKTELEIERARLVQRLRRDMDEQREKVSNAIRTFEEISKALYEEAGSLTLNPTDNGLKVEITIQGQRSRGIQNMQIFCFDLMLMKLSAARGTGPGFLVHDSHLFDGVDERQIAKALQLGAETANECNWQYFVTMNSDDVPSEFPNGFNIGEHVLPVRLTDSIDEGGLFGFRF
jgi:uncharacterized protein YydD (DUF2326 family)